MYGGGQHGGFIVCTVSFQGPEQQQDRVATRLRLCQFNLVIHIVSLYLRLYTAISWIVIT